MHLQSILGFARTGLMTTQCLAENELGLALM